MSKNFQTELEIERKYIIKMPDFFFLSTQEDYTKSEILQIYLSSENGETHRIRYRRFHDREEYTETKKIRIDEMSVTEIEGEITKKRFDDLAEKKAENSSPVIKVRHTFVFSGQIFEIDVYPEWDSTAIMETELKSRDDVINMPSFISIIKEVTGDKKYSNAAMSRSFPAEIK